MIQVILLSAALILIPIAFYYFFEKRKTLQAYLGLEFKGLREDLKWAFYGFAGLIISAFLLISLADASGVNDTGNVFEVVKMLPLHVLFFLITVQLFAEEVFFRAFLVPKIGVLGSALVFGAAHAGYNSGIELIGAFLGGLILAIVFSKRKSIWPCVFAHLSFNLISLIIGFGVIQ